MFYFILLIAIFAIDKVFSNKAKNIGIILITTLLVLISGLRYIDFGHDTSMYGMLFNSISRYSNIKLAYNSLAGVNDYEKGYLTLEWVVSRFGNFQVFLFVVALITQIPVGILIYKHSKRIWLSYYFYITFGYFSFSMNGIRQSLAIAMLMLAFCFAKEKKIVWYIVFCILAISFHKTAIVFIPMYWLDKITLNKRVKVGAILVITAAFALRIQVFTMLNKYSRITYEYMESGGTLMCVFMLLTLILGLLYSSSFKNEKSENKIYLYFMILSAIIWPIASANPAVFRLYFYFHIYILIFVPNFLDMIRDKELKYIYFIGFMFVGISFLVLQVIPSKDMYYPYHFFWKQ